MEKKQCQKSDTLFVDRQEQSPAVHVGQRVKPGDLLVRSNMTDAQGQVALGANARVVMMPFKGLNYEDSMVVSESMAKRLTSQHMYQNRMDWTEDYKRGKHAFMGIFPSTFKKAQLDQMDENGVIQVGSVVKSGDPLVLAARANTQSGSKKGKKRRLYSDSSITWDHHDDGVVTDVFDSDKGTAVLVKSKARTRPVERSAAKQLVEADCCFDEETDILTSSGWKRVAEVTVDDKVACCRNGVLTYENPIATFTSPYGRRMYRISTQQVNLFVTADHLMWVKERNAQDYSLARATDIIGRRVSYKKDAHWSGSDPECVTLPAMTVKAGQSGNGKRDIPEWCIPLRIYLAILGAYIADGNLIDQPASGTFGIDITKPNQRKQEQLKEELDRSGIRYGNTNGRQKVRIHSKQLFEHFRQFGHGARNKRLPQFVFEFSKESLTWFFEWLMWGDGCHQKGLPSAYTTVSHELAGDVQRLCLHIGKAANIITRQQDVHNLNGHDYLNHTRHDVRIVNTKLSPTANHSHVRQQSKQEERVVENYNRPVHGMMVPGGIVYVRRNGIAVWCGGCGKTPSDAEGCSNIVSEVNQTQTSREGSR